MSNANPLQWCCLWLFGCRADANANDPMLEPAAAPHGDDAAGGEVVVYDTTGVDIKKKPGEAVLLEWLQVLQQHVD